MKEKYFINYCQKSMGKNPEDLNPIQLTDAKTQFEPISRIIDKITSCINLPSFGILIDNYIRIMELRGDIDYGDEDSKLHPNEFRRLMGWIGESILSLQTTNVMSMQDFYETLLEELGIIKVKEIKEVEIPEDNDFVDGPLSQ